MMDTESSPTNDELKTYLKDADMYEENMSYEDMLSYYNVIKCSESTAQEEQEKRDINVNEENIADDGKSKSLDSTHEIILDDIKSKSLDSTSEITLEDGIKSKSLDSTPEISLDDDIEDDDSIVKSSVNISPTLNKKYKIPKIKTNLSLLKPEEISVQLLKMNSNGKEDIDLNVFNPPLKHKPLDIIFYERKYDLPPYINPKYNKLSNSQRAQIISNFHKIILEKFYKLHCESINPAPWGRPIPASDRFSGTLDRKSQSIEDSFDFEEQNSNIDIYTSRSGRQTKRKVYIDEDESLDNDFKKSKKDEDKLFVTEKKSATKRPNLNKLNNQDIMKRSKLFFDPPKSSRAEKLFDQLKKDEKASVTSEIEIVNDNIKLHNDNDLDIVPISPNSNDIEEMEFPEVTSIRRRIPPPIRGRRGIGPRKTKSTDATKSTASTSTANTPSISNSTAPPTTPENKKTSLAEKTKCPICSVTFFQDEIETHASSCGLLMETQTTFDTALRNGSSKKIKCEVCDMEMTLNTDYQVHVQECIARKKREMEK